jgi:hypothetical protein
MRRRGHIQIARKRSSLGAPTATPIPAAIITIDAAKRSGVAVYLRGRLHHYTEVLALDGPARRRVLREATTMAEVRGLPIACVIEVPWGGHASAALSLTATVALWRDSWVAAGHAPARMLEFTANEWRRALFAETGMPRAQARRLEAALAAATARRDMPEARHYVIGPDAAAAICIGQVVIRSGAVATALELSTNTGRRHTV